MILKKEQMKPYYNRQYIPVNRQTTELALRKTIEAGLAVVQKEKATKKKSRLCQSIGEQVKGRRNSLHISQEKLAKEAKVGASYLAKLEGGEINISIETLEAIAASMGCRVEVNIVRIKEPNKQ